MLSRRQLERLVPLIHRFSLMTYDFHHVAGAVGADAGAAVVPNSPLPWVKETVEAFAPLGEGVDLRGMVLLGLPFYGERTNGILCIFFSWSTQEIRNPGYVSCNAQMLLGVSSREYIY